MQAISRPRQGLIHLWERQHPARRIFAGFVALNLAGWGLLMLPISREGDGAASWIEALFTAVSAACVTGLTVVDLETGEIIATNDIQPDRSYWRNTQKAPGRWPEASSA